MGIEPTLFAWEARVLPLNDARMLAFAQNAPCKNVVLQVIASILHQALQGSRKKTFDTAIFCP